MRLETKISSFLKIIIFLSLSSPLSVMSLSQTTKNAIDAAIARNDFAAVDAIMTKDNLAEIKDYLLGKLGTHFRKGDLDREYFYDYKGSGMRWKEKALKVLVKKMKEKGEIREEIDVIPNLTDLKGKLEELKDGPRPFKKYLAVLTKWDHYVPLYVQSDENDGGKLKIIITESSNHDWVFDEDWGKDNPNIEVYFADAARLYDQHNCSMLTISDLTEIQQHEDIARKILSNRYEESEISGYRTRKILLAKMPVDLMKLSLNQETARRFLASAEGLTKEEEQRLQEALRSNVVEERIKDQVKYRNKEIQNKANRNLSMVAMDLLSKIPELIRAVKESDVDRVKSLIAEHSLSPNVLDQDGHSLLQIAHRLGNKDMVKHLVGAGASPLGIKDFLKIYPELTEKVNENLRWDLVTAVGDNNLEKVEKLLDIGMDLETKNFHGRTLLEVASYFGHKRMVSYLVDRGANKAPLFQLSQQDEKVRQNLAEMYRWEIVGSVDSGDQEKLGRLLDLGVDINTSNSKNVNLLNMAIYNKNEGIKQFLLSRGASRYSTPNSQSTKFRWEAVNSVDENNESELLRLLEQGADINSVNSKGKTLLQIALHHKNIPLMKILIEKGADITVLPPNIFNGELKELKSFTSQLLRWKLVAAADEGDLETLDQYLGLGLDTETINSNNKTLLEIAAWHGNGHTMKLLLNYKADPTNITFLKAGACNVLVTGREEFGHLIQLAHDVQRTLSK